METLFWGATLRCGQALLASAPTILVGLVLAGTLRRLVGREWTLRAFGGNSWRTLPQAWLWGMLLPVCSLGVIPVARELRRAGVSEGAVLAFALTAPLFNPLSLLYGLTLSEPVVIVSFALSSLIVVTVTGFTWDRLFAPVPHAADEVAPVPPGIRRMAAVAVSAARETGNGFLLYWACAMAGNVILSVILAKGSLGSSMVHGDPWSPLAMLIIATSAYVTPLNVMMQVGSMFVHGNSVGAAYVLLVMGSGVNLGLLVWCVREFRGWRALAFPLILVVVVLGIAYSVEYPLHRLGNVDHPHTHAFDVYSAPFGAGEPVSAGLVWHKLSEKFAPHEVFGLVGVLALVLGRLVMQLLDRRWNVETFLEKTSPSSTNRSARWDVHVPAPILGAVAVVGCIALSVVGCYVFYPHPAETLADMTAIKAEALTAANTGDTENAVHYIELYDDLTRRLQVGYWLRSGRLSDYQRARAKMLRGYLEQLKDGVEAGEWEQVSELRLKITNAHRRCREAFSAG